MKRGRPVFSHLILAAAAALAATPRPVAAQVPTVRTAAAGERIRVDGKLDERAWQSATPIREFTQVNPREGKAPTEETEVRVLVDSEAIYFGIACLDRQPAGIVSSQLTRDADLEVDDHVIIVLDPFFDQRNGFFFVVNPAGARVDGQIANNDEHPSYDWDGIWNAGASLDSHGWAAEISIPFKTLRFKPGQTTWGLNIERQIKRRNETDRWSGARRDVWITNLAEAGRLENVPAVRQGLGLDLRPYGLVRNQDGEWDLDGGLDVSKNIAPNLNASLTINTDFAETEADARQVNLTRFPLFYPEKRPFFLEGAGVFETAAESSSRPDIIPFFSRRIGLNKGLEVPVIAGGKITGRQSRYNIGVLDVQTDAVADRDLPGRNLFVARVSRDIWRQSYVGAIFTRGNPSGASDNSLIGADARLATSGFRGDKNLSLDLYLYRTDDQAGGRQDYAGGFKLDYPNDLWDMALSWLQIGDRFEPALGFVPRRGIRKTAGKAEFRPRPEKWGIRQMTFEIRHSLVTDLQNRVESWSLEASPLRFEFDSGDQVTLGFIAESERLDEPFDIAGDIVIPGGSYTWHRVQAEVESATKRPWVIRFEASGGGFYGGTRRDASLGLTLKPSHHLLFGFRGERSDVSLPQGNFFAQIFSLQADCNFSPDVSWANLVQYDSESRILGLQSRFRWILRPGNDLFLVVNRGWYRSFNHDYLSVFDKGTLKLQYTFRY